MTSRHEHTVCAHDLKHCDRCDVAYCGTCSAEWRKVLSLQDRQRWALGQLGGGLGTIQSLGMHTH